MSPAADESRLEALERTNRELSRMVEDLRQKASQAGTSSAPRHNQLLRRVARRLVRLVRGRGAEPKAQDVLDTGLFDAAAYKTLAGLGLTSDRRAAAHYATIGEARGLRPCAAFDPVLYASVYPEIARVDMGLFVHYARHGRFENRIGTFTATDHLRPGGQTFDPGRATIMVVCHEASRTGAPILGWNIVRAFGRTHNIVTVVLRSGELVETFAADSALIVGPFEARALAPRPMQQMVEAIMARCTIDVALVNSVESHPILTGLAAHYIPAVSVIHEFPANVHPAGTMTGALQLSTQVVFDAEVQRRAALEEWPGITRLNQHVFHQGASEIPRAPVLLGEAVPETSMQAETLFRRVRGGRGDRPVVLGLGTISMRKGVDLFIICAAAVAAALGPDGARFVWIGNVPKPHPDGLYGGWITDQIKRAGLEKSFALLDPVDNLDAAYAAADIVISPSRLDPFPNVAMDAALAGVPVICFEHANGFAEFLVEDPQTRPLAVPYLDVAAASDLVVALLGDDARRRRMGAALKARSTRDFAMARYVERLGPVIAEAKAIVARERADVAFLEADDTFSAALWLNPHEIASRAEAIRMHVRKAASGQEANQYCRRPALGFVPQTYAEHHPALEAAPFENPLAHWVRAGKPRGPWWHEVIAMDRTSTPAASKNLRAALHLHLHYPELSDGILVALAANASACDLFVSTTSPDKVEDLIRRFKRYTKAPVVVRACPNRGRDIGPMLTEFADVLQGYDVVGHFHGKRSLALTSVGLSTELGVQWHDFLLEHLLGPQFPMVDVILGRFAAASSLGLVFPEDPNLTGWSLDRDLATALAARMDPAMVVPRFIDFPIGTMFWARPRALKPLFDLKLDWADYPDEPVPIDGTMLHALERLLPVVCHHAGFVHATTHVPGVSR